MLAALGLGRLERLVAPEVAATAAAEPEVPAEPLDMHTLAREGMPEALDYLHRREEQEQELDFHVGRHRPETITIARHTNGVVTRSHANPQYGATRHVNRV
jgi:hypothetical protein